jgi:glutamine synthetase adenylyltransferase
VQRIWRNAGQQSELFFKIDNMLERIRRERGTGSDFVDFKTGTGGMIEAEFLVQALQMRSDVWSPNWSEALRELGVRGLLSPAEVPQVSRCYDFLRQCEMALRRWENKSVSALPADSNEQQKLAHRLGFSSSAEFAKRYGDARGFIHALYERHLQRASG